MRAPMVRTRGGLLLAAVVAACHPAGPDREHVEVLFTLDAPHAPAPRAEAAPAAWGAALFTQPLGGKACADCHVPEHRGQDGRVHGRDTPALADVVRQARFGWDGVVIDLATMVRHELARHHGIADDASLRRALANQPLSAPRAALPPGTEPTLAAAAAALVQHLASWRTRGRWDRYVEGDDAALSAAERSGAAAFVAEGCATCHGGRNLGGATAHVLGLALPFASADRGRELVTGVATDRQVFRAPMLRHAARTAPFLHDGSVATLEEMVELMGRHELGKQLAPATVAGIATFLRAVADVDVDGPRPRSELVMETGHGR